MRPAKRLLAICLAVLAPVGPLVAHSPDQSIADPTTPVCVPVPPGLVSWWPGEPLFFQDFSADLTGITPVAGAWTVTAGQLRSIAPAGVNSGALISTGPLTNPSVSALVTAETLATEGPELVVVDSTGKLFSVDFNAASGLVRLLRTEIGVVLASAPASLPPGVQTSMSIGVSGNTITGTLGPVTISAASDPTPPFTQMLLSGYFNGEAGLWDDVAVAESVPDVQNGNPGELRNGAMFAAGKVGRALRFDGVDGFVTFGNTVGNFGTSDFTVDFWIKTSSTRTEGILGKRPVCAHSSFWDIRANGKLTIELDQDSAATNYNSIFSKTEVNDGNWHLVAVVRSGTTVSVYIDDVLDSTGTTSGVTHITNSADLHAGRSGCTGVDGTQPFTGLVDEIEIYNLALSQSEIQAIFNAGSAGKCQAVGNQPPVAKCKDVTVSADAVCTATALIDDGSFDPDIGDTIAFSQSPTSFGLGPTTATLVATDNHDASSSCTGAVTVVDTTAPAIICPAPMTAECTGNNSALVTPGVATASDNCSVMSVSGPTAGSYPLGSTTVTYTATDGSANISACSTTISVVDTMTPSITSVTLSPSLLWPPNHAMVPVVVSVTSTDVCDAHVGNSCQIVSVTSNEPINGPGDGNTAPDYRITGKLILNLRAERFGEGNGRVYTVVVACTDVSGNSSQKTVAVTVPHDQGN